MSNTALPPPGPAETAPAVRCLTRREFVAYTLAMGAALAGTGFAAAPCKGQALSGNRGNFQRLRLTDRPSQNPAFRAKGLGDGGALLWVRKRSEGVAAFHLNREGRLLFDLCDGRRSAESVCRAYAAETGRTPQTASAFLEELVAKGLIVQGGYLVFAGEFPSPGDGGSYVHRF